MPSIRLLKLVHEGAWVMAGQGLGAMGAVVVAFLLARGIPPNAFGLFSLGLTASAVGQSICFGPWANSALRFDAVAADEGRVAPFLSAALRGQLRLTVVAIALGAAAAAGSWIWSGGRMALLAAASAITVIAAAWAYLAGALQTARRQRVVASLHQGATPWLRLAVVYAAITALGPSATATMIGWMIATIAIAVSQWAYIPRPASTSSREEQRHWGQRMLAFASPFVIWGIFSCFQVASDRWALRGWVDLATVGTYSIAFQLGYSPAQLLGLVVETMLAPVAFASAGTAVDPARLAIADCRTRIAALALIACTLAGTAALFLARPILRELLPSSYAPAVEWIAPLFLAGGLTAASQVLAIVPMASLDTRRLLAPKVGIAIAAMAMILTGAWAWGVRGVVAAQIATAVCGLAWMRSSIQRKHAISR